jgi:hypothetical protein
MTAFLQDASLRAATVVQGAATQTESPHAGGLDSAVVNSPLPGGVAEVVRFLLNTVPSWVQLGGIVVGAIVAVVLGRFLLLRRREIVGWVTTRERGVKALLAVGALVVVVTAAVMGQATWGYTQHSNEFCTGCHVMKPAFQRYTALASKHDTLSCHACHTQSMFASARQLYLWLAERPQEIGEHAKVENRVCESCHATGDAAKWQRIKTTAGHRVHLESDSSTLQGMQCVTCHGVEVHSFVPADQTCGQSECHSSASTKIVLGKMAGQTMLHCSGCHAFTDEVVLLATRDSAAGVLRPGSPQCLGCHEMKLVLPDFDQRRDPHAGKCGTCHNPHTDSLPSAALATCAACHDDWRNVPFHVGASHRRVGSQCSLCHQPHSAKVDASGCEECHQDVRSRGRLAPPVRFDTAAALRRSGVPRGA